MKAKALALGLAKPGKELTNQAKIMARYALIQEGLAKAQGDLERTGGGFANQWRQFTGQLQNMAATIGQFVLPILTLTLRGLNFLFSGIANTLDWFRERWDAFWEYVGMGGDKAADAVRQADIDARNQKLVEQERQTEANAQAMQHRKAPFRGGLEDWAHKIAESAAGGKQNVAKQQLGVQQKQLAVAEKQLQLQMNGAAPAIGPAVAA